MHRVFLALGDPTRLAILDALKSGEKPVGELVALTTLSGSTVTRHLDVLERSELITRQKRGTTRLCALNQEGFEEVFEWFEDYETYWTQALDRLKDALDEEQDHD